VAMLAPAARAVAAMLEFPDRSTRLAAGEP
jgi:hypothetical protein